MNQHHATRDRRGEKGDVEMLMPEKRTKMKTSYFLFALVLMVVLGSYKLTQGAETAPAVGSPAPDFTLDAQDGKPVSLNAFRGKWVVLYFYPKDFTSGCTLEAHNFQRDLSKYEAKNAVILGVSVQNSSSHKEFCAKEGLNFKLLADTKVAVSSTYGSVMNFGVTKVSARHTFLIDPDGVIAKEYMDVDPGRHSEEVLAALTELEQRSTK
jgi:peroxiredoxin Q/BCP